MAWYIIDIINFILLFLLIDFFNGIHNNYFGIKLKRSILVILLFVATDLLICTLTSFCLWCKISLLAFEIVVICVIIITKLRIDNVMQYSDVEAEKESFFGKQKVMILVPHEDDEINLTGGVIEEYIKHGSEVYIVFATNGDAEVGEVRLHEAIKAAEILGVPEKNVVFLGYGDGWDKNGPHIYNAPKDEVLRSSAGHQAVYGLKLHPAYHDGNRYTYDHFFEDIKQVVLEYKPDTIFCIDYDTHNDHRALSMLFEKAMGEIIKQTEYRPKVYKGYAYRTAWNSFSDYGDSVNLLSTRNNASERDVRLYRWEDRVRLPVDIRSVSRDMKRSRLYCALGAYQSQKAIDCADRIINGDKVFWKRRTDSLLYNASISVSSGDKDKLTDFMLLDCDDLVNNGDNPYDGVWHPDDADEKKSIYVDFDTASYIDSIRLYDNPSPNDNIINALFTLDDGTVLPTGKISLGGTSVSIKRKVKSFIVKLDQVEGNNYGLTEIEAYASPESDSQQLYKITDEDGNFAYDYIVPVDGKQVFRIYSTGARHQTADDYRIVWDNRRCEAELDGDMIRVACKADKKCELSLCSKDDAVLDRILVRNPGRLDRSLVSIEKHLTLHKSYAHRVYHLVINKRKRRF